MITKQSLVFTFAPTNMKKVLYYLYNFFKIIKHRYILINIYIYINNILFRTLQQRFKRYN